MFINRLPLAVLFALSFSTQILFAIEKPQNPFEKPKIQNKETINNNHIYNYHYETLLILLFIQITIIN